MAATFNCQVLKCYIAVVAKHCGANCFDLKLSSFNCTLMIFMSNGKVLPILNPISYNISCVKTINHTKQSTVPEFHPFGVCARFDQRNRSIFDHSI